MGNTFGLLCAEYDQKQGFIAGGGFQQRLKKSWCQFEILRQSQQLKIYQQKVLWITSSFIKSTFFVGFDADTFEAVLGFGVKSTPKVSDTVSSFPNNGLRKEKQNIIWDLCTQKNTQGVDRNHFHVPTQDSPASIYTTPTDKALVYLASITPVRTQH